MNSTTADQTREAFGIPLTGGTVNNRARCSACKHMVPLYVDRGDGEPLRRDYVTKVVDPSVGKGNACVQVFEVLPVCPRCGYTGSPRIGRTWGEAVGMKVKVGKEPCGIICWEATGSVCKCICGGSSHGII